MQMTTDEILRDYRAAKSKQNQIGVLADLNCCKARDIVNILLEAGEHVPGNFLPGERRKKKDVPVAAAQTYEPVFDPMESVKKLQRAKKGEPENNTSTEAAYKDILFWLAYGEGACWAIEDDALRESVFSCFSKIHKALKELTA